MGQDGQAAGDEIPDFQLVERPEDRFDALAFHDCHAHRKP